MPHRKNRIIIASAIGVPLIAVLAISSIWVLKGGLEKPLVPSHTQSQSDWQELQGPLISTRWEQDGAYAGLAPGRESLGCWSVAFAQVLAFHRLAPKGQVSYRTNQGAVVEEEFGPINWDKLVPAIGSETPEENSSETARYCYDASVVVQKDFGRGEYMDIARVPDEVSEHYGCTVRRVESGLEDTIKSELRAGRPLVVYFDDILDIGIVRNGHAAVLDGMAQNKGRLLVHVNFGWGGESDGWYDFQGLAGERKLLYAFRIVP